MSSRRLRALADRTRPTVEAQIDAALRALQDVPLDRLEAAFRTRDALAFFDLATALQTRLRPALQTLARLLYAAGDVGRTQVPGRPVIARRFDARNPFAADAARREGARLVTQVTDETRAAIRAVVAQSFETGLTPAGAARALRPLIGLTRLQTRAVLLRRAALEADGVGRASAVARTARYASRLIARRAAVIARTEIIRASSAGQLAAWQEARVAGRLGPRARKQWIVTPDDRLCVYCRPLDGVEAPLDGTFRSGPFRASAPPLHPQCRCALGVVPVVARAAA